MTEYLDKKFPEKIKEFYKHDNLYFSDILNQTSVSITKNMHPIIAYNYPELLVKFYNSSDLSNIIRSPSIMLHYKKNNLFTDKFTEEEFNVCEVIKKINDKEYTATEVEEQLKSLFDSKRQRSSYSKSYPELHDKFESVQENYLYNMILIALEQNDYEFIIKHIDFAIDKFKNRLLDEWSDVFEYLDYSEYSDQHLLKYIDKPYLAKYSKYTSTILQFWKHNQSTMYYPVNCKSLFDGAIELGLDIKEISTDWLNDNAKLVITHFPYFYSELNYENMKNKEIQALALRDPYNIRYIGIDKENVKRFLNYSNTNILDAHIALEYCLPDELNLLKSQINEFEGMFLALQSYPLLITLLTDDEYYLHVTPYLINHTCKIDSSMFEYFKLKEEKRWLNG